MEVEQATLDKHDEDVAMYVVRIQHFIEACTLSRASNPRNVASRRLLRLRKCLISVDESVGSLPSEADSVCVLHQHQEQLSDFKAELADVRNSLLSLDLGERDELNQLWRSTSLTAL